MKNTRIFRSWIIVSAPEFKNGNNIFLTPPCNTSDVAWQTFKLLYPGVSPRDFQAVPVRLEVEKWSSIALRSAV